MIHVIEVDIAGRTLRLETGRVAKQADGSIWASYGDTVVLCTVVAGPGEQGLAKSGPKWLRDAAQTETRCPTSAVPMLTGCGIRRRSNQP